VGTPPSFQDRDKFIHTTCNYMAIHTANVFCCVQNLWGALARLEQENGTDSRGKVSGAASLLDVVHRATQHQPPASTSSTREEWLTDLNAQRAAAHEAAGTLDDFEGEPLSRRTDKTR